MEAEKTFNGLPSWAKGVIALSAVGVTFFIGYKVYKAINKSSAEQAAKELTKANENELNANVVSGMKATFPASQYPAMANQIYEGMKYCVGDDYGTVRDTLLKVKNDLDVNLLIKSFGKRQAYCFGIPAGDLKDLFTFVKSELGSEYAGLTSYKLDAVNADWAKKGIKYRI